MNKHKHSASVLPTPSIGVGGIVFNKTGDVLLIKRGQPPACGSWSIPGGRLEPGECLASTCRREFYEETNLAIEVNHIVAVVERKLEGFHYIIIDFIVDLINPEDCIATPQSDVTEAAWVNPKDFAKFELVPGLAEIILRADINRQHQKQNGLYTNSALLSDFILPTS